MLVTIPFMCRVVSVHRLYTATWSDPSGRMSCSTVSDVIAASSPSWCACMSCEVSSHSGTRPRVVSCEVSSHSGTRPRVYVLRGVYLERGLAGQLAVLVRVYVFRAGPGRPR